MHAASSHSLTASEFFSSALSLRMSGSVNKWTEIREIIFLHALARSRSLCISEATNTWITLERKVSNSEHDEG